MIIINKFKFAQSIQGPGFNLVRIPPFPQAKEPPSPLQNARIRHVLHHLRIPHHLPSLQHRKRATVREPPLAGVGIALLHLGLRLYVPCHEIHLPPATIDLERPQVAVPVQGVDGGAVVVGEESGSGEVVRAGGEVVGQRAVDEAEGYGLGGFSALGDEEELVVPEGGDGVV